MSHEGPFVPVCVVFGGALVPDGRLKEPHLTSLDLLQEGGIVYKTLQLAMRILAMSAPF